jgi:hypothetical protein
MREDKHSTVDGRRQNMEDDDKEEEVKESTDMCRIDKTIIGIEDRLGRGIKG